MVYEYYGHNDWRDYHLAHYGVLGMHWGIRRYQPYGSGGYDPQHKGKFVGKTAKGTESNNTYDTIVDSGPGVYTDSQRNFARKEVLGSNPAIPKELINKLDMPDELLDGWLDSHMALRKLEKEASKEYKKNGFSDKHSALESQADSAWDVEQVASDEILDRVQRQVVEDAVRKQFGVKDVSGLSDNLVKDYYDILYAKGVFKEHPDDYSDPEARSRNIDRDLRDVNDKAAIEIVKEELSKTWVDIDKNVELSSYEAEDYLKERSAIESAIEALGTNKKVRDLKDLLRSRSYEFAKDNWDRQKELKQYEFEEKLPEVAKLLEENSEDRPMSKKQYEDVVDKMASAFISEKDISEYRKLRNAYEKAEEEGDRLFRAHVEKHKDLKKLLNGWSGDGTEYYWEAMGRHPDKHVEEVNDRATQLFSKAEKLKDQMRKNIYDRAENTTVYYKDGLRSKKKSNLDYDIINRMVDKQDRQAYKNGDADQIEVTKIRARSLAKSHVSQAEIAKILGISPSTVSDYINE